MRAEPEEATHKAVFADWLSDHPGTFERQEAWEDCFRRWSPAGAVLRNGRVTPDTLPLFHAVLTGLNAGAVVGSVFTGVPPPTFGRNVRFFNCVFSGS